MVFGITNILYILLSRTFYEWAYYHDPENWRLPAPVLPTHEMNPLVLWGLFVPEFLALTVLVLLMDKELTHKEYGSMILIAGISFLADLVRLFPKMFSSPPELTVRIYLLYCLTGILLIGGLWMLRVFREKKRERRKREIESLFVTK